MAGRRSIGNFVSNWDESPLPAARKALLAARNLSRRILRLDACCGRPGEPGC